MIRNVIIHMGGEQPLMADLRSLPTAEDACLVCVNLRTRTGQKPIFIEEIESWFLIPLQHIRFVEIPAGSISDDEGGSDEAALVADPAATDEDLELDEDFLRRIKEA